MAVQNVHKTSFLYFQRINSTAFRQHFLKMLELRPCINLPLPEDEIKEIVQKAIDWALMHGKNNKQNNKL